MSNKKKFSQPQVDSNTVTELSQKLFEANAKLKQTELERKQMLENISHDLRAPLTAIRSTVDYLKQKSSGDHVDMSIEEAKSMLKLLDGRVRTLEIMIQDLYYLTCIESGREELKLQDIPISQFLEEYFFSAQVDEKYDKRNLILEVPDDFDKLVRIDVDKMSRVLDNFFTNAYKYSDDGAEIALGVEESSGKVRFYVRDTGRGIPEEAIPHVFDRTYRVSGARTPTEVQGSGLGLSIVKSIVEQHNGRVWCESKFGEGSCFIVELPLA